MYSRARLYVVAATILSVTVLSVTVLSVTVLSVTLLGTVSEVQAERRSQADSHTEVVEMFAAMDNDMIEVAVVPADSKKVTIRIKNKTDRPLAIRLPNAMAAVPILAQFQPNNFFNNNNNNNNNNRNNNNNNNNNQNSPQTLGVGNQNRNNQQMVFNVPAGKVIKQKLPAVCMEHGKPEPAARMPFELRPLSEVTKNTDEMVSILQYLATEQVSQRVAQVATWHVCNDMEWEALAGLKIKHLNGQHQNQFSLNEVKTAKSIFDAIQKAQKKTKSNSKSNTQLQSQFQSQYQSQSQAQRSFAISR
jgi:hypothetical protein